MLDHTALFIAKEGVNIEPDNGLLAVVRADVHNSGPEATLMIIAPTSVVGTHPEPQPLNYHGNTTLPLWREVESTYAGPPRTISRAEYVRIWRAWWFARGGHDYKPLISIELGNGHSQAMVIVWETYLSLRSLVLGGQNGVFETLGRAAHGQAHSPSFLRYLWTVDPVFADRMLGISDDTMSDAARRLLRNFIRTERGRLCLRDEPWRAN